MVLSILQSIVDDVVLDVTAVHKVCVLLQMVEGGASRRGGQIARTVRILEVAPAG